MHCMVLGSLLLFIIRKTNENNLKILSFNDKDKIKGKVNSTKIDFLIMLIESQFEQLNLYISGFLIIYIPYKILAIIFINLVLFLMKTNEKKLKTLSLNHKDKINGKLNNTRIDFLM
ncbi:hypothetical protein DVH24_020175 [Malus domestica]|uniref:Uncharacterized protein n=1 Tax=Malus domestica TaxID=3750 RepID=A0A498JBJ0_MALDO|nr:hypothetical protein DVH24_020175 [Malus domestica]